MRDMVRDWIKDQESECCEYFEKGKNEALSALDSERADHTQVKKQLLDLNSRIQDELDAAKFSLNDVQSLVGIQQEEVADLNQRMVKNAEYAVRLHMTLNERDKQVADLRKRISELEADDDLNDLYVEIARLQDQRDAERAEHAKEVADLKLQLEELKTKLEELKTKDSIVKEKVFWDSESGILWRYNDSGDKETLLY